LILGAGGVIAAITGYQMSEVKKERLELEYAQKQAELKDLNTQYEQRKADYDKLGTALKALSTDLDERAQAASDATAKVERTHSQLIALRDEVQHAGQLTPATSRRLQGAIDDADSAKTATLKRDADLAKTKAEIQRLSVQQVELSRVTDQLNLRAQRALGAASTK
jgi:chromosome segregation ATPase